MDAFSFLFACETSLYHSFKRLISGESKPAVLKGSKKWLYNSNTSLSANSISLLLSLCFLTILHVSKTLLCHFPVVHKLLLLHVLIPFFELRFKSWGSINVNHCILTGTCSKKVALRDIATIKKSQIFVLFENETS